MENHGGPLLPFSAAGREERKTVEPRKPHGVGRHKFNPTNPTAVFSPASPRNNDGTLQVHKLPLSYVRLTFDDSRRERGRSSKRHEERPPRNPSVPAQLLRQFSAVVSISSFVISPTTAVEEGGGGHRHAESDRAFGGAGKNPACTSSHHVKSGFISR
ncbi:hypothetical protein ALC62_00199 [Cyphomyrmex costatus]|uniref:Uncharacterized protein n=1 Tax=Cyphomyrmex costatus TaxID=456900 RepID=A0A195D7A6_9HYME|nr:hypothetical protein ALC62_00199 [Cyphomyrmex costatus]